MMVIESDTMSFVCSRCRYSKRCSEDEFLVNGFIISAGLLSVDVCLLWIDVDFFEFSPKVMDRFYRQREPEDITFSVLAFNPDLTTM